MSIRTAHESVLMKREFGQVVTATKTRIFDVHENPDGTKTEIERAPSYSYNGKHLNTGASDKEFVVSGSGEVLKLISK